VIMLLALIHGACPRHFGGKNDARAVDDAVDDVDAATRCDPRAPFTSVRLVSELNIQLDGGPRLSFDELTAYYHASIDAGTTYQIWMAKRVSRDVPFDPPAIIFNNGASFWPAISPDELSMVYDQGADLYLATRGDTTQTFANESLLAAVSGGGTQTTPFWSAADNQLYYTISEVTNGAIHSVPMPSFNGKQLVAGLDTAATERAPVLSHDGTVIYFMRHVATEDIFMAQRADLQSPWSTPVHVPEVGSTDNDAPSWLSPDLCRLYLESARSGGYDIYLAERTP